MLRLLLFLVLALCQVAGCKSAQEDPEPLQLKIRQRRELPVPGSNGEALVHVSDIRNGAVAELSIRDDMGKVVASATMRKGETLDFAFYSLTNKTTLNYQLRVERYEGGIADYAYLSFKALPRP